jgi:outer membrane receptor for ferrienterochelin and colicins
MRVLPGLLLVAAAVAPAAAEESPPRDLTELPIEELMKIEVASVSTASKHLQKVTEAPASVSIVTADEIRKYGYRTLADVLRSVRGFHVTYDRNYSSLGVRGFGRPGDYNNRILLLVDGHRVNDAVYDGVALGTDFPLDVDLIDRVEIVRGPGSSLYGSNAFFAVVHVITKRARDVERVEASGDIGSYETYKGRLSAGVRTRWGLDALASGSYYDSAGRDRLFYPEFNDPATNNGVAQDADGDSAYNVMTTLSQGDFTLRGVYGYRKKHVPTGAFGTVFNDPGTYTVDEGGWLDLQYEHRFANDLGLSARLFYDHYNYYGDYIIGDSGAVPPTRVVNRDVGQADWWGAELRLTKVLWGRHRLTVGGEYRDTFRLVQKNYHQAPRTLYQDDRRSPRTWGLYAQQEIVVRTDLLLNVGLRYDSYETFGDTINPRAALIYNPAGPTTVKLLYGEAFRAPNAYELYYAGVGNKANPDLDPETVRTGELVIERYLGEHFLLVGSAFYSRVENLINQETDPADGLIVYRNSGAATARGVEVELRARLGWGVEGRASYTLQRVTDDRTDKSLSNAPTHLAKLNVIVPVYRDLLYGAIEAQYTGQRRTLAGNTLDDFVVVNLTLFSHNLVKGVSVSASVYNLLDTHYRDPGGQEHVQDGIEQDGRSVRLKLTYRY